MIAELLKELDRILESMDDLISQDEHRVKVSDVILIRADLYEFSKDLKRELPDD